MTVIPKEVAQKMSRKNRLALWENQRLMIPKQKAFCRDMPGLAYIENYESLGLDDDETWEEYDD